MQRLADWLVKREFVVILLCVMILLKIPNVFEPYWYGDEGISLSVGHALSRGERLYTDVVDNKTPMIYWWSQLTGSLAGLKIALLLASTASVILFYQLSLLFIKKRPMVWFANYVFMLAITLPTFEGNVANGELFFIPWVLAAMLSWWKYKRPFLAGCFFGLAILTKVPALLEMVALILFWLFTDYRQVKPIKRLLLGSVMVIGLSLVYFGLIGTLGDYIRYGLLYNFHYIQAWESPYQTLVLGFLTSMVGRVTLFVFFFGWLWMKRKKFTSPELFLIIWLLTSLFAALISLRPYPHYFLQIMPAAALMLGVMASVTLPKRFYLGLPLLLAGIAFKGLLFNPYPTTTYYRNFLAYLSGQISQMEYYQTFDKAVVDTYAISKWLVLRTNPEEKTFIWGDEPLVYALARRPQMGRYTAAYHVESFKAYDETMAVLEATPPKYIIDTRQMPEQFPRLYQFLQQKYAAFEVIGRAKIYRRLTE